MLFLCINQLNLKFTYIYVMQSFIKIHDYYSKNIRINSCKNFFLF